MIRSRAEYLARWSDLHGNARPSAIVRAWLAVAHTLAMPLARLRISPDVISLLGVVAAVGALELAAKDQVFAAAGIIVISLIFDGLDGAVAVLRGREGPWGAVVDALLDRLAEALWAITLVVVGVPVWIAVTGWVAAFVQEYARARHASLIKSAAPIVISICERPVRALLIGAAVMVNSSALPMTDVITPTSVASVWIAMQLFGAVQVVRAARDLNQ